MPTTTRTPHDANSTSTVRLSPLPPHSRHIHNAIRQLAHGNGWPNTLIALRLARSLHEGQRRRTGEPYFCHPLAVAWKLIEIGAEDDVTIAAALLHDVLEDCVDHVTARNLHRNYGLSPEVADTVLVLTHRKSECRTLYYARMAANPKAIVIKLADRWHNLTTMNGVYNPTRKQKKLRQTIRYVLPLCKICAAHYLDTVNHVSVLEREIESIIRMHLAPAN